MARSRKEKQIVDCEGESHRYVLIQFGASEGVQIALRLAKMAKAVLGPMATTKIAAGGSILDSLELNPADIGEAVKALAGEIQAEGGVKLILELMRHVSRDGIRVADRFDEFYQGNYAELLEALAWVVMENFGKSFSRPLGFSAAPGAGATPS